MREGILSESVTWQNGDNVHVGRTSVISAIKPDDAISVKVDDVVTHGKAAAVSGRLKTEGEAFLFCHMIKFTSASAKQIASIVSFKHRIKANG